MPHICLQPNASAWFQDPRGKFNDVIDDISTIRSPIQSTSVFKSDEVIIDMEVRETFASFSGGVWAIFYVKGAEVIILIDHFQQRDAITTTKSFFN